MKTSIILILCCCILSGCGSQLVIPEKGLKITQYRIGAGDQLYINVWKNPDLSLSVPVRPDGHISVPLVGDADATNKTAEQLAAVLTEKLAQYIRAPKVTVIVTAAISANFSNRVRIIGAVRQPKSVPYSRGMTILDLVLHAGSLTEFSNGNSATLYRKTANGTKSYTVEVENILKKGDLTTNYEMHPSDVLIIPESVF